MPFQQEGAVVVGGPVTDRHRGVVNTAHVAENVQPSKRLTVGLLHKLAKQPLDDLPPDTAVSSSP
jgi:hypothetical protein